MRTQNERKLRQFKLTFPLVFVVCFMDILEVKSGHFWGKFWHKNWVFLGLNLGQILGLILARKSGKIIDIFAEILRPLLFLKVGRKWAVASFVAKNSKFL